MAKPCFDETRSFTGCSMPPDQRLSAEGWELRFLADARMARDALETYGDMGFEVKLQPLTDDNFKDGCADCKILFEHFKAVYTRKKESPTNGDRKERTG